VIGADGPELRDRDLELGEHLQEEGLEAVVRAVDLVDEEDGGGGAREGLEERPLQQVLPREDRGLERFRGRAPPLRGLHAQELARVVPLVERGLDVDPLVALQADQLRAEDAGEDLGDLGLAHSRVALDEERLAHLHREVECHGDGGVGDVAAALHRLEDGADLGPHPFRSAVPT
jgi:hypothetical protein